MSLAQAVFKLLDFLQVKFLSSDLEDISVLSAQWEADLDNEVYFAADLFLSLRHLKTICAK